MADENDSTPEPPPPPKAPSLVLWLAVTAGLSVIAIGIGGGAGIELVGAAKSAIHDAAEKAAKLTINGGANTTLVDLPPVITNLADPSDAWIRLQASIVVDNKITMKPNVLAAEIADDMLGFLKSVTLAQIGGASGLQHLREDLTERAVIRSEGHVRELIIQTLVVQ